MLKRPIRYSPLPSQDEFHALETRFKGFSGPVGSGKSAALCFEAFKMSYDNPGRTGLIGAPTYNMLRDATLLALEEFFGQNHVPYSVNRSTMTLTLAETGSRILLRSLDDAERLRGTNLAWFGVDELTYCSEDAWMRLEARLRDPKARRLGGFAVWTPKGFDWVYRRFRAEPVEGYGLVEAKAFENRFLLRKTPDFYDRLKASYDEAFYRQEVLGDYINLQSGQVYYAFARKVHVGEFALDPEEPLLWSLDFNVNPMTSVLAQRRGEMVYVVGEIFLRTSSTPELCEEFLRRYGEHRAGVRVCGDASGEQRRSVTGSSDFEIVRRFVAERRELEAKVLPLRSNPPVRHRINLVNGRLRSADGETRLLIDRSCRQLIKDLEQVCYKADSAVVEKDREGDRTHLSDALGYLLWQEFEGMKTAGERGQRLL